MGPAAVCPFTDPLADAGGVREDQGALCFSECTSVGPYVQARSMGATAIDGLTG